MSLPNEVNLQHLGSTGGYTIDQSLRFRNSASAYLNRTYGSPTNQQKWTWSGWVKRSLLGTSTGGTSYALFGCDASGDNPVGFLGTDKLTIQGLGGGAQIYMVTTQVFRDTSAWYHIVIAYDATQATASNRVKLYVNGSQVTAFDSATYPAQNNTGIPFNTAVGHSYGKYAPAGAWLYDGYMAEIYWIDGQQLDPSSFGQTDTQTGVWQPKKYSGTYGNNGSYLKFADNSGVTAATLGKDSSGNGNNWTPNNFSVSAGYTYDWMRDSPTLGTLASNYCVINPLTVPPEASTTLPTITQGNLYIKGSGSYDVSGFSSFPMTSGKWYCEFTCVNPSNDTNFAAVGIAYNYPYRGRTYGILYSPSGNKRVNDTSSAYGATWTTNDVIGIAVDATNNTVTYYKNGASQGAISYSPTTSSIYICCYDVNHGTPLEGSFNFGQQPFAQSVPSGYSALNTYNLSTPTIGATSATQANKYFDATLFTGTSSSPLVVNNAGSFKPDFVWVKRRSSTGDHALWDSIRGISSLLQSDTTNAEYTDSANHGLNSFNSNGFTLGLDTGSSSSTNSNGSTYVGWQWQAGQGSSSSNTNGSITSTVSVNASAGFSVVSWVHSSTTSTIGHGLSVAPTFIILKSRTTAYNWDVGCTSIGWGNRLNLNSTAAAFSPAFWNSTAPTSTVFTYAGSGASNGDNMIAYCWTPIAGFSAFGSYTGNGSTDGPFVYTGFKPRYILIKRSDSTSSWYIVDTAINTYNEALKTNYANLSNAEGTNANFCDFLSNGFKMRESGVAVNGGTYIYAAFAENSFKYALAR